MQPKTFRNSGVVSFGKGGSVLILQSYKKLVKILEDYKKKKTMEIALVNHDEKLVYIKMKLNF